MTFCTYIIAQKPRKGQELRKLSPKKPATSWRGSELGSSGSNFNIYPDGAMIRSRDLGRNKSIFQLRGERR